MSSIISIKKAIAISFFLLRLCSVNSQEASNHIKLVLGGGYGHYINSLTNVSNNDINPNQPVFAAKILWQAEHRLRVGIESGYYGIYSTSRIQTDDKNIRLTTHFDVIPIFINISMVLHKNIEVSFSTGYAYMMYSISSKSKKRGPLTGSTMSRYNTVLGLQYNLPIGKRLEVGAEIKYFYLGKTFDTQMQATLNLSYKIISWR
ncbi:MAG: hypothetical protein EHM93_19085 [Bacteroidales bacterium]|nr:MAG: hypothetical protein EHM93_19085 [Bacteroidales bacterium]